MWAMYLDTVSYTLLAALRKRMRGKVEVGGRYFWRGGSCILWDGREKVRDDD